MGQQDVARFFCDIAEDEDLRTRYWESMERATMAAAVELAGSAGYEVSVEDIRNEFAKQTDELSDDDLEAIAGGAEPLLSGSDRPDPRARFLLPMMRGLHAKY